MKRCWLVVLFCSLMALASCEYGIQGIARYDGSQWTGVGLTRDGTDVLRFDDSLHMWAEAGNVGSNTRIGMVPREGPAEDDGMVCATWASESSWLVQEGVLLGWSGADSSGVTFTKNIYGGATWTINAHEWRVVDGVGSFVLIGQWNLSSTTHGLGAGWRLCGKKVGSVASFIVWPSNEDPPTWSDSAHGGSVITSLARPGRRGLYMGHIPPGGSAAYSDLSMP